MNKIKRIGMVAVLTLALSLSGVGVAAGAALTLSDTAVSGDAALTLTGAATSTWSLSAGNLTIDSAAGDLILDGGGTAATSVTIVSAGGIDIDSASAVTIDTTSDELQIDCDDADVVIAGDAEGTAALTLTKGDLIVTDGDLTLTDGEATITASTTTSSPLTLNSEADSTVGVLDLNPDMVSGEVIAIDFVTTTLTGALTGIDIDLATNVTHGDQNSTAIDIVMTAYDNAGTKGIVIGGGAANAVDITLQESETIVNGTDDTVTIASNDADMILKVYSPLATDGDATLSLQGDAAGAVHSRWDIISDTGADTLIIKSDPSVVNTMVAKLTIGSADGDITTTGDIEIVDDMDLVFGTGVDWNIRYDEAVDDQLLFITAGTTATATTDPMVEFIVGATPTENQEVFGIAKGTQASNTALLTVDEDGDAVLLGDLTITGDDITMTTNTVGALLVGDDTNFNPVVMSGDATIAADGAVTIANDAVTEAKTADSDGTSGLYVKKTALAVYDFAVDGGVVGAIVLNDTVTLPDNAVVTALTYDVITTVTTASADAGTIALSLPTDGALTTAIAVSDGTPWDAGVHLASVITPIAVKTTAARAIGITIGTQAVTAGKIVFAVEYYVSQ